ncbi:hypothetical protein BDW75DRAFT_223456 [Aspergillus navahoensis]
MRPQCGKHSMYWISFAGLSQLHGALADHPDQLSAIRARLMSVAQHSFPLLTLSSPPTHPAQRLPGSRDYRVAPLTK